MKRVLIHTQFHNARRSAGFPVYFIWDQLNTRKTTLATLATQDTLQYMCNEVKRTKSLLLNIENGIIIGRLRFHSS